MRSFSKLLLVSWASSGKKPSELLPLLRVRGCHLHTPNLDWSERKRQAVSGVNTDFPSPRVPEDEDELTVQQLALQDQPPHLQQLWVIFALEMKHPHDVIDPMDLDLAMSGVFRAVPLLPDSEKLGRIQVFTDSSAMLERAWPYRRTSAAWGAVLVQMNSQGLDALIGFLGDTVQTHQHPQYLGARVKTISTAELSAIITTLATVMHACSKPPQLNFFLDSVFSIKVLQRQSRACSNVELIQCGRALVDQARRITQVTFQHVGNFKDVRFYPIFNFGHFWAALLKISGFYPTRFFRQFWADPIFSAV